MISWLVVKVRGVSCSAVSSAHLGFRQNALCRASGERSTGVFFSNE